MSPRGNVTKNRKGTYLCALFLSCILAGCAQKKAQKSQQAMPLDSTLNQQVRVVNYACGERDLPLPLQTTVEEEGSFSGCYKTFLTHDEFVSFCKKAYEIEGWDVTDFSNSNRLLLVGNKPEKMVVIDGYSSSSGKNVFYVSLKRWDVPALVGLT